MTRSKDKSASNRFEQTNVYKTASLQFPLMDLIGDCLKERETLAGLTIGWHCHLTAITAVAARALLDAGCKLVMSECNPQTSEALPIEYMREIGTLVHTGSSARMEVLEQKPQVISDTGFDLLSLYLDSPQSWPSLIGASEITTSGIARLRATTDLPIPVLNLNDGIIKSRIENHHGVGDGVVECLRRLSGRSWAGERATVIGYGNVGQGVARYLKATGALVYIVESRPTLKLLARFDGYGLTDIETAASASSLVVSATGRKGLIGEDFFLEARDSLMLLNVGHWPEEIDLPKLKEMCSKIEPLSEHLEKYSFAESGTCLYLACQGNPANVAMLAGSIEPTLLHLATEILSIEFIWRNHKSLKNGENALPQAIEEEVASLALKAVGN